MEIFGHTYKAMYTIYIMYHFEKSALRKQVRKTTRLDSEETHVWDNILAYRPY